MLINLNWLLCSGKLLREENFHGFCSLGATCESFLHEILGIYMCTTPTLHDYRSAKVFSHESSNDERVCTLNSHGNEIIAANFMDHQNIQVIW